MLTILNEYTLAQINAFARGPHFPLTIAHMASSEGMSPDSDRASVSRWQNKKNVNMLHKPNLDQEVRYHPPPLPPKATTDCGLPGNQVIACYSRRVYGRCRRGGGAEGVSCAVYYDIIVQCNNRYHPCCAELQVSKCKPCWAMQYLVFTERRITWPDNTISCWRSTEVTVAVAAELQKYYLR